MRKILFIVWKNYQRRAEVISPKLKSEVLFIPHLFRKKLFRPIDYVYKLLISLHVIFREKPAFIIAQSPPLYSALAASLLRTPYLIDAHNPVFQDVGGKIIWGRLPLTDFLLKNALAIIVHNHGILKLAKQTYPSLTIFNIPDPIEEINSISGKRLKNQVLVICSFDSDEPVDILLESIAELPTYNFIITADPLKLPQNLQVKLKSLPNIRSTGFLPTQEYHNLLCSSAMALVLTNRDLIQPSGACEALSANTQLIVSNTPLIKELFGEWATLVENTVPSIVNTIQKFQLKKLDLSNHRNTWNRMVHEEIKKLLDFINHKV